MAKNRTPARSNVRIHQDDPKKSVQITKRQVYIALAVVAAVILAIILIVQLTRKDITSAEDNWVVLRERNGSSYRYYKLGETGDIEGFQLSEPMAVTNDELNRTVCYVPVDEDNPIENITYYYSLYSYEEAPELSKPNLGYAGTVLSISDTVMGERSGMNYSAYTYRLESTSEETGEKELTEWLVGYVDAGNNHSALIGLHANAATEADFLDEDTIYEYFYQALDALTLEK